MKKIKVLVKIIAAALIASLMMCTVSCGDTSWAVKSGENTVSAGIYLGYLAEAYNNAYYTIAYSSDGASEDIFEEKIGDQSVEDYIKDTAMASVKEYLTVTKLFKDYGLKFTPDETKIFEATLENYWASIGAFYEENGCGKESYKQILLAEEMKQKVFEHYYGEKGEEPVSEKERKEFFTNNYAKIKYIDVKYSTHFEGVTTDSTATADQKDTLKKYADGFIDRINDGEKIDDLINEENELISKAAEEEEHTHEDGEEHTHEDGEEHTHEDEEKTEIEPTFIIKDTSDEPSEFNSSVFKAKFDTPVVIKNGTSGYYVVLRYKLDVDGKDYTDHASDVLDNMKGEDFAKVIEKAIEKVTFEVNDAAINRYKPQNIIGNF